MNRYAQMISELKTPEVMKRLTYLYGQRGGMLVAQSARYSRLLKRHEELVGYEGPIAMVSAPGRTEIGRNHTDHNRARYWPLPSTWTRWPPSARVPTAS